MGLGKLVKGAVIGAIAGAALPVAVGTTGGFLLGNMLTKSKKRKGATHMGDFSGLTGGILLGAVGGLLGSVVWILLIFSGVGLLVLLAASLIGIWVGMGAGASMD